MSSSEGSSSDSEFEASAETSPQRGTTSKRKSTFEPPHGATLMGGPGNDNGTIETGEFDWNSIKDDKNIELWLVRIPSSVCPLLGPHPFPPSPPSLLSTHALRNPASDLTHFTWCRSNQNISMMPSSTYLPHRLRTFLARSSGNTRYMTCGPSATVTKTMSTTTRSGATK